MFEYKAIKVVPISTQFDDRRGIVWVGPPPVVASVAVVEVEVHQILGENQFVASPTTYHVLCGNAGGCILYVIPFEHEAAKILETATAARLAWRENPPSQLADGATGSQG
jgi:hypothetical protein